MAKKIVKMKSSSTNVRYIKAKQRGTHFLLTALWHLSPNATKNILLKGFFKPMSYAHTPLERQYLFPKEKKMRDSKSIIEEYRNADFEKRLYLFLSHRSLRDEFLEIDQSDTSVGFSAKRIKNKCRMCGNWGQSLISALK